jgi:hypothetical protein
VDNMNPNKIEFTDEEINEYANQLLTAQSHMEAAIAVCEKIMGEFDPGVGGRALLMVKWLTDDVRVQSKVSHLKTTEADLKGLPSKGEFARILLKQTKNVQCDDEVKLKYFRLIGETLGYVGAKGAVEINNNNANSQELPKAPVYEVVEK